MQNYLLLAALCLSFVAGCKRGASRLEPSGLPAKRNAQQLLGEIERSLYLPALAEMKGDMRVNTESIGNLSFNAVIRVQRDSVFWITLRKLGFEGARARITQDSIIVLNRLQREAMVGTSADLPGTLADLPFDPTLNNLLAAFSGAPIGDWKEAEIERRPGMYAMRLPAEPAAQLEVRSGPQPVPVRWLYQEGDSYGEVVFTDFRPGGKGQVFPYRRTFTFSDVPGDTTYVELDLSSLTAHDALDYPINVPRGYEVTSF